MMFKYLAIAFLMLGVEASAATPYYYYYSYWNGYSWQYQWVRGYHRDPVEREHARLDYLERKYELENRKNELRRAGILPQTPAPTPHDPDKSGIGFQGRTYRNAAELKASPEFQQYATAREEQRQAAEDARATRLQQANVTLKKYRYSSSVDNARRADLQRANEILSSPIGRN